MSELITSKHQQDNLLEICNGGKWSDNGFHNQRLNVSTVSTTQHISTPINHQHHSDGETETSQSESLKKNEGIGEKIESSISTFSICLLQ